MQGVIDGLNLILDLAVPKHEQEGGTYVIPGHGRVCGRGRRPRVPRHGDDRARPRSPTWCRRGATLDQVKAARPTLDYDRQYGATSGPSTTAMFIEAIYQDLSRQRAGGRK